MASPPSTPLPFPLPLSCCLAGQLRWRKAFYKFHASDYASYQSLQPGAVGADPWAAVTRSTKRNPICVINGMRLFRCLPLSLSRSRSLLSVSVPHSSSPAANKQLCFKILRPFHALQDATSNQATKGQFMPTSARTNASPPSHRPVLSSSL